MTEHISDCDSIISDCDSIIANNGYGDEKYVEEKWLDIEDAGPIDIHAIVYAIRTGDHKYMSTMLRKDNNMINMVCPKSKYTPLILAASLGKTECVRRLLSYGASINHTMNNKDALQIAVSCGHLQCANLLLQKKIDLARVEVDKIIYDVAITHSTVLMKELLATGIDVSHTHAIMSILLSDCITVKHGIYMVRELMSHGASIPSLKLAVDHSNEALDLFLKAGANPDEESLALAIRTGCINSVVLLLDAGANPNMYYEQESLLCLAINCKNIKIVELLLKYGANPNERDRHVKTC